ncbi:MAG: gamma-glutamylcyclotransferase, partial [Leptolyngbyaceae cyanobacterium SM1_1_3]|nr:gamma-glutamylcyclotransferase [Leptolyngbyaceae cyanobacterium SM1_1_3]
MTSPVGAKLVFICGSALRGQPDHQNLRSATFVRSTQTAPKYRLHSVSDGWHPGIYRTESGGVAIPGELYEMTAEQYQHLKDSEPPHMYPETIELEDGDR